MRERTGQKRRTRQDLLQAATRLMKRGQVPTLAEVAEEALVSRATAYRYFSSDEALLADAPLEASAPTAEQLFSGDPSIDPEARLLKADAALHQLVWGNQAQFRLMLARSLEHAAKAGEVPAEPLRLNRRTALIEAALAPVRDQFDTSAYQKLCAALALVLGTESMVVFRDVLRMDEDAASEVETWAVRALTRAALAESDQSNPSKPGKRSPRQKSGHRSIRRK
ncbi:MAG: TetR/AcrR family transcriptional regulator [Edaphobacter sp.]